MLLATCTLTAAFTAAAALPTYGATASSGPSARLPHRCPSSSSARDPAAGLRSRIGNVFVNVLALPENIADVAPIMQKHPMCRMMNWMDHLSIMGFDVAGVDWT